MKIGDRLKKLREDEGWSQQFVGDKVGVTRAAISQWEHGKVDSMKTEYVQKLARLFKVPESTFERFGGNSVIPGIAPTRLIPLIPWHAISALSEGGQMDEGLAENTEYIEVSEQLSENCKAFTLVDDSMMPEFAPGEEIIVDPAITPDGSDDFALVRLATGETLFRRYRPRTMGAYDLVPENPDWETVSVTSKSPAKILGTMVEHRKRRRR